nr:CP52k-like protein 6 [Membranobalanus longirostrum]
MFHAAFVFVLVAVAAGQQTSISSAVGQITPLSSFSDSTTSLEGLESFVKQSTVSESQFIANIQGSSTQLQIFLNAFKSEYSGTLSDLAQISVLGYIGTVTNWLPPLLFSGFFQQTEVPAEYTYSNAARYIKDFIDNAQS